VTVLRFVDAEDLEVLMSDTLTNFFFDVLEASSETGTRCVQAFCELCSRAVTFGLSESAFVVRLLRFLQDFPDDLSEVIDSVAALIIPPQPGASD
jgi:hypothetical protein